MPEPGIPVTRTNHDQLSVTSASGIYCMVFIYIYIYIYIWSPPPQDLPISFFNGIFGIKCVFCISEK